MLFRSVLDAVPGLVSWVDSDLRYLGVNRHLANAYGLPAENFIGKEVGFLKTSLKFNEFVYEFFASSELKAAKEVTASVRGISTTYLIGAQKYHRSGSSQAAAVFVGLDISDRKQMEVALRRSEERSRHQASELERTLQKLNSATTQLIQKHKVSSMGQLVASVAHEINNPINFISGNISHASNYTEDLLRLVELYQQYYPEPIEEIEEEMEGMGFEFLKQDLPNLLNSMTAGSERIREVVRSLRLFSRVDEAEMKPVDLHEGLDSALLILQNRLQAKGGRGGISAIKEYGKLPKVDCYPGELNQVFMHLLTNAVDALEERYELSKNGDRTDTDAIEPTIWIRTRVTEDNCAAISIVDNGPGMTGDVCRCIFDPLFSTKPPEKGTGLGLSISRDIVVDKHGGKLYCKSQPGLGAEFVVEIPVERL